MRLQALTSLDVSCCVGAGDAFLLQLLGGRFWDVRDCLPVQYSGVQANCFQTRSNHAESSPLGAMGVGGAEFVDACALVAQNDSRSIFLLEQALQVFQSCINEAMRCTLTLCTGGRRSSGFVP
jgi:hypothetical protein